VTTLTGRRRGRLLFGEAHRAEYLDLADDAAKAALYALVSAGMRVVAFAETTIVVETPVSPELPDQVRRAGDLTRNAIEQVLPGVPAACVTQPLDCW
jgi:hypothetical protein